MDSLSGITASNLLTVTLPSPTLPSLYQLDIPVTNELLDTENKTYTREVFMPAGALVKGMEHKRPCINIFTKGKFLLKTNIDDEGVLVTVPENQTYTFISQPGSQKFAYIIEDTIVINIFSNVESQDYEQIKDELVHYKIEKELTWHSSHQQLVEH